MLLICVKNTKLDWTDDTGTMPHYPFSYGSTPLRYALRAVPIQTAAAELLIKLGADVDAHDKMVRILCR